MIARMTTVSAIILPLSLYILCNSTSAISLPPTLSLVGPLSHLMLRSLALGFFFCPTLGSSACSVGVAVAGGGSRRRCTMAVGAWLTAVGVAMAGGGSRRRCTVVVGAWLTAVAVARGRLRSLRHSNSTRLLLDSTRI
jgi:hypothetical protein